MAKESIIQSGQITLPRILFLAVVGALITTAVAVGGIALTIGYWVITLGFCGLLFAIARDYGVKIDPVTAQAQPAQSVVASVTREEVRSVPADSPIRRKANRPAKRRR